MGKTYKRTDESRELYLYAEGNKDIYHGRIVPAINNMKKRIQRGRYIKEKGIVLWEHIMDYASKMYEKDFGYSFDKDAKYTAAVDLEAEYYEMIVGGEI